MANKKARTEKLVSNTISSAQARENIARSNLAKRLHFVPIQLGELNVLEEFLGRYVKFNPASTKAKLEKELTKAIAEYELQKGRLLGGKTYEEANPKIRKNIDEVYETVVLPIQQSMIFNFSELKDALIKFVKEKHKGSAIITSNGVWTDRSGKPLVTSDSSGKITNNLQLPCVVYLGTYTDENIIGVLYSSYNSAGSGLFTPFFNKIVAKNFLNLDAKYKKYIANLQGKTADDISDLGIDIGHLAGRSDAVITVLQERFKQEVELLREALFKLTDRSSPQAIVLEQKINQINDLNTQLLEKSRYGTKVEQYIEVNQPLSTALSAIGNVIVVIPQERYENQYLYGSLVEGKFARELATIIVTGTSSPSLINNIALSIATTIKTGKNGLNISTKGINAKIKIPKTASVGKKASTGDGKLKTLPIPKISKVVTVDRAKNIQTTNLTNLQNLLNARLVDQVKRNMGNGTRSDVLNLQTGRFAESVEVTRLSESRQGMITAFYTYMKNPYSTFSTGGNQEFPRSRDPKTLISKSIREIAAEQVGNRLRSVLV